MNFDANRIPPDVRASLRDALRELHGALAAGDHDTIERTLSTVRTVVEYKVPDPDCQRTLRSGCEAVTAALAVDDVARAHEHVRSMRAVVGSDESVLDHRFGETTDR